MRILNAVALGLAFLVHACALGEQREEPARPMRLFDGASLSGWTGDPRFWRVEDGAIVGESTAANPCERTSYLLWSGGEIADFDLSAEFRIFGGNSGIHYRSREAGDGGIAGPQADLAFGPDPNATGCIYEVSARALLTGRGERVRFDESGAKSVEHFDDAARLLALVRPGEWNTYRILAQGPRVELWINGARMCALDDLDPAQAFRQGTFALQLHQGTAMRVEFRNLELTELAPLALAVPSDEESTSIDEATLPLQPPPIALAQDEPARANDEGLPEPQWLWTNGSPAESERAWFRKGFALERDVASATLWGSGDNALEVFLDGAKLGALDDWAQTLQLDVSARIGKGEHVLAAWGMNQGGPAALWVELVVELEDGTKTSIVTDSTWRASAVEELRWNELDFDASAWSVPTSFGELGVPPWGSPRGTNDGAGSGVCPAEKLELAPGFAAELVYTVPRAYGSWVTLCFDDRGRIWTSDQYGKLYRLTLHDGGEPSVEPLELPIGEAHGLLWAKDSLYAVVSSGGTYASGLYRVRDTNGDDVLDQVECLKTFAGDGEHGPHSVVLAPDGESLYVVGGNHTDPPAGIETYWLAPQWAEDQLLPRVDDPGGHAVGRMAPGGWICKTDFDGAHWELFAAGFRNTYDAAFDATGELYTFDADMEWDVGLPWYRPARICHVIPGAEFGWRHGSGKWPSVYPDSLPGTVDIGLASPTGVVFGTGAKFPGKYSHALFAADWAYGVVWAVTRPGLGSTASHCASSAERLLRGKPLPVTDLSVGPDGALYVLTGGRRTQSALYRITWRSESVPALGVCDTCTTDDEAKSRTRRRLASLLLAGDTRDDELIWAELDNPDREIQFLARSALEHRSPTTWSARVPAETRTAAFIEAAIALLRSTDRSSDAQILEKVLLVFLFMDQASDAFWDGAVESRAVGETEREYSERQERTRACIELGILRILELAFLRGSVEPGHRDRIARTLASRVPGSGDMVDRESCRLLAYLDSPAVIPVALGKIRAARTQEEAIHYGWCLRVVKSGWTLDQRREFFRWMNEVVPTYRGGASLRGYMAAMRRDAIATLSQEETLALGSLVEAPAATGAVARPARSFVRAWSVADLEPRLEAVRGNRSFERGRDVFLQSSCLDCHHIAGEGGARGPELTGAGARFSPRDLLETIVDPSKTISDQYQDTEFWLDDESLVVGRAVEERDDLIVVRTQAEPPEMIEVPRARLETTRPHPLSSMPSGLLDTFLEEEILDLLAYVLAGGDMNDPRFVR